jgi:hypothetical protein
MRSFSADDPITVLHETDEPIEHLRLDRNRRAARGAIRADQYQAYDL